MWHQRGAQRSPMDDIGPTDAGRRSASHPDRLPDEASPASVREASETTLREVLRDARKRCGISQMELALRLGFSPRHICFVEIGRARPSRMLIERWLDEVGARPSVRSAALLHAGFALKPAPANGRHGDPAAHPARELFERLLAVHEPFPAFLFDADWHIRSANRAALWLMSTVMPDYMRSLPPGNDLDMIGSCAHPSGLLSNMVDAASVGYALLDQLDLEASANPRLRARVRDFARSLDDRFGPRHTSGGTFAHLTFSFATAAGRFDFFRFQSLVELPQDVTLHSLRAEVALPLNERTKDAMRAASATFLQRD